MMGLKVTIAALMTAGLFSVGVLAKTPDGMTPAEETICNVYSGMNGPAFGLCNAYCEAHDCGDPNQHSSNRSCTRINDHFERKTGFRLPEGFNAVDEHGNWINNCLVVDESRDFGDAPLSFGDASHVIIEQDNPYLGSVPPDSEEATSPDDGIAMGDDTVTNPNDPNDVDDEGFGDTSATSICGDTLYVATGVPIEIPIVGDAFLNIWIDWNNDGDFGDIDEQVITDAQPEGAESIFAEITPPSNAWTSSPLFVRLRYSTEQGIGPTGPALDGEVEDCTVDVLNLTP